MPMVSPHARLVAFVAAGLLVLTGCTGAAGANASGVVGKPPTPGSVTETVSAAPSREPLRFGLQDTAEVSGISIRIDSVVSQHLENELPGESSGPGLVFSLRLRNGTSSDYRTDILEVNLLDSSGATASRITGAPASNFPATVVAGTEAQATYVFRIAADRRKPVSLSMLLSAGSQPAVFSGDAP